MIRNYMVSLDKYLSYLLLFPKPISTLLNKGIYGKLNSSTTLW